MYNTCMCKAQFKSIVFCSNFAAVSKNTRFVVVVIIEERKKKKTKERRTKKGKEKDPYKRERERERQGAIYTTQDLGLIVKLVSDGDNGDFNSGGGDRLNPKNPSSATFQQ